MAEEEKDDWLEDTDDNDDSELDQSDIDSLLSSDEDSVAADDVAEADQSDVDSLLASDEEEETPDTPPSQNEIDQLFSEVDDDAAEGSNPEEAAAGGEDSEEDPFKAEELDFKDLAEDSTDDDFSLDDVGDGFDAEEFGLDDDIPDVPDIPSLDDDNPDDATVLEQADSDSGDEDETVFLDADNNTETADGKKGLPITIPPILQSRMVQAIAGGCVVLIIVAIFLFRGKPADQKPVATKQIANQQQPTAPAPQPKVMKPNTPPQVADSQLTMGQGDNELSVKLNATDAENDPLDYEILSLPEFGKLSGKAPNLIYLPNKDFKGQDSLVFRVSDGQNVSIPATIKIIGATLPPQEPTKVATQVSEIPAETNIPAISSPPEVTSPAVAKRPKVTRHKKLVIAARSETYHLSSDKTFRINWKTLWSKANYLPYTSKIRVEIVKNNLHGRLYKTNSTSYKYEPDKFFGGTEIIKYRFRLARLKSKIAQIRLKIDIGNPAPEIHLAEIAPSYFTGERVVLDASASRDDNRSSLVFSWKQLAGVPVQLEMANEEGSEVTFVAPSSFNTIKNPGPVLRLTITDQDNQKDVREFKIKTKSRRHSAIWNDLAVGGY